MEIYSCGFYFPEESGVNNFKDGVFFMFSTLEVFPGAKSHAHCYLLAKTHRLRSPQFHH